MMLIELKEKIIRTTRQYNFIGSMDIIDETDSAIKFRLQLTTFKTSKVLPAVLEGIHFPYFRPRRHNKILLKLPHCLNQFGFNRLFAHPVTG